mgnify:CR=1 FL=1
MALIRPELAARLRPWREVIAAAAVVLNTPVGERYLADRIAARTRRGLRALLNLVPDRATVLRDGTETVIAPAELRVGDRMLVRPGERVATDGLVRAGRSSLGGRRPPRPPPARR